MDVQILKFFNNFAGCCVYLDALFIFLAVYFPVIFVFLHFIFLWRRCRFLYLFWSWILAGAGLLIKEIISLFYWRVRPFEAVEGIRKLINKSADEASFPSGHTLVVFILAFSIFWMDKKWGAFFIAGAALVAISRIIVGAHYPADILGGFILALVLSCFIRKKT